MQVTSIKGWGMHVDNVDQAYEREFVLPRRVSFSSQILQELIIGVDSIVILAVALVTYFAFVGNEAQDPAYYVAAIAFVWLVSIALMNMAGLYQLDPIMRPLAFADKFLIAFATTILFLLAAAFAIKISGMFSRTWIASFAVAACSATVLVRCFAGKALGYLADRGFFTRRVVIVGAGEQAKRLLTFIEASRPRFISVLGAFCETSADLPAASRHRRLGGIDKLGAYVRTNRVDDVIVALPWSRDEQILTTLEALRELPVNAYLASDLIGFRLPFKQSPDHFGDMPVVEVMGRPFVGWGGVKKQALDYALTIVAMPVLLPVMALIALAIKLESPGPVFFRQERYGFANEAFLIWKFRTMRHEKQTPSKTLQATPGDPRVTRVGRLLRRTSLDELPQVFNVLNGTMSLVGPRPHAVDHNEEYSRIIRGYFARHRVKPGITGWAQVNGLRGATKGVEQMEARVKHDIYYTEHWSLLFDLRILAMTVAAWITGRNAY
jgi:Undecaprenyl-phosphate glucose phosphotransferase